MLPTALLTTAHRSSVCVLRSQHRSFSGGDSLRQLERRANDIIERMGQANETVSVAEWTSGGLISAMLWTSPAAHKAFKGSGVRLAYGVNRRADREGVEQAREYAKQKMSSGFTKGFENSRLGERERGRWGLVYEDGVPYSEVGTPVHALELAHAAKLNLGTTWGIGESCVPGPTPHHRTGQAVGSGYVAVAGPDRNVSGVLRLEETDPAVTTRLENMVRFARAALDLMAHLQQKSCVLCTQCGKPLPTATATFCVACGAMQR